MLPLMGGYGWYTLALILFLSTFGPLCGLWLIFFGIILVIGFSLSLLMIARMGFSAWSAEEFERKDLPPPAGAAKLLLDTCKEPRKLKIEKRMTNSSVIDDVLQEILDYIYRDYIHPWYHRISEDQQFHYEIRNTFQKVIIAFSERARDIDLVPYLTTKLVDDFASHIRLYRRSLAKVKEHRDDSTKPLLDLESTFFDLELEMEKDICRDQICLTDSCERRYLQEICEVIMFILLPPEDFQNKIFRYVIREVLVNGVLLPTMNYVSDPDHINQTITLPCKDIMFNNECFLTILRTTDSVDELLAVREKVDQEVARQRSKDTGGDDDTLIKQQLSSLLFVHSLCEAHIERINRGIDDVDLNKKVDPSQHVATGQKLYLLSFDVVLNNNVALPYFIDFMSSIGMQHYLFFYLTVEGYRVSAEQQISASLLTACGPDKIDLETLHDAALSIFNQYLSEKASPRLKLDDLLVDIVFSRIKHGDAMDTIFNDVQAKVYDTMQEDPRCFPAFKRSQSYIKLLIELDLLQEGTTSSHNNTASKPENGTPTEDMLLSKMSNNLQESSEDLRSSRESISSNEGSTNCQQNNSKHFSVSAHISNTGICQEHGKSYAIYLVSVVSKKSDGSETTWDVYRRFSDFYDLHSLLQGKFDSLSGLILPSKKAFDNMNKEFLEKRKVGLNTYLQTLLNPGLLNSHKGLLEVVHQFLENSHWEREKSDLAKKMDSIVNPFKRSVGNMVRNVPNSFADSVAKVRNIPNNMLDGVGKMLNVKPSRNEDLEKGKVSASLDFDGGEDSIPLHIMLLLMDETFDLKNRNQWLRRRIVAILQQVAKTMFGDSINRKIIESVAYFTSPEQVAEYLKLFRETFWPGGKLAEGGIARDYNTKMRTRVVCKTKLYGSLSDELRHLIGSETTRQGVMLVFNMFQHQRLNKRLAYVIFEGLLQTIFPENKFSENFRKIHSQSPRIKNKMAHHDPKFSNSVHGRNQFR